jgi:hypothetical protein
MLKKTLNAYHNRAIDTQEVIDELIKLAEQMSTATQRGVDLGLNEDKIAFREALAANDSAVEAMGKDELKVIAAQLVTRVPQERHHRLDSPRELSRQNQSFSESASSENTATYRIWKRRRRRPCSPKPNSSAPTGIPFRAFRSPVPHIAPGASKSPTAGSGSAESRR